MLDEEAVAAVGAVWHVDLNAAELWFATIREEWAAQAEDDTAPTWNDFKRGLAERAPAAGIPNETVEGFVEYVEANLSAPMDVLTELAAPDLEREVLEHYEAAVQQAGAAQDAPAEPAGHAAWAAYLEQWQGGWDGTPDSFAEFKESFTYHAVEAGVESAAVELVDFAESVDDAAAALEPYGLVAQEAAAEPVDEAAWAAYLEQWQGGWDGSPDSFAEFKESFTYYAAEAGVETSAAELIALAETADDPAGAMAEYGLVATATASSSEPREPVVGPAETDQETSASEPAAETAEANPQEIVDNELLPALADALREVPEAAAELTDEELREILMEVLNEQMTEPAAAS